MRQILIFSTAYLPMQGGAELAVKEITDRIRDYEFNLICARLRRDLPRTEKIGNVVVHRIGFGNKFDKILLPFMGFLQARKIYKNSCLKIALACKEFVPNCKLKIAFWGIMASWGSLAALIFKIFHPRVLFLLTLQEGDAEDYIKRGRWGLINLSWKCVLAKADFVQTISGYLADIARKYGYQGKMEIVPNGVDLDKYQVLSIKYQKKDLKKKLGIEKDDKIIITVSRLVEKNGISDLISSAVIFDTLYKIHNTKYLILGGGPLEEKLKLQVSDLKIKDKVIFLGDVVNEKIFEYLAISDVFCRPSLSEGLGTAFLEAMAMGVPIIGTRVGGIPDFLRDGETGLFCEVKNPKSIAEKINLLLIDENLRQKLIANSRKLVEEKYDWNKISEKMYGIFKQL